MQITIKNFAEKIIQDVMSVATPRQRPFHSDSWRLWEEGKPWFQGPLAAREATRKLALAGQPGNAPMELREVNAVFPKTSPELEAQQEVYNSWERGEKQYSSRHLHAHTKTQVRYRTWREARLIPEFLDFHEYWFLSEWLRALGNKNVPKPDPLSYRHLAPTGFNLGRKFTTKVGKTYRDWLLLESVGDERVKPTYYKAMCRACGHTVPKFNYSRVAQPCGNCRRITKSLVISTTQMPGEGDLVHPPATFSPINLWLTPDGWIAQVEKPLEATARMVLQELGKHLAVERLEEPRQTVENSETSQTDTNQVVKPQTGSKSLLDLSSLMEDLEDPEDPEDLGEKKSNADNIK